MSSEIKEWAVVIVFLLCFPIFTVIEALWLAHRTKVSFWISLLYSLSTNLFACIPGFFISFVIFGVMLMLAWDGTPQRVPVSDASMWVGTIAAVFAPLVLLILLKRLAILIFKLLLSRPWLYSVLASLVFYIAIVGLPATALFIIWSL